jgi:hypothetical protein
VLRQYHKPGAVLWYYTDSKIFSNFQSRPSLSACLKPSPI